MSNLEACKVVLLGETTVGKTSIISRFINDSFDPNCITSLGASFISKSVFFPEANKTIKFDIWDTAGQEKYRSLAKIFYKDAVIIIFVYDITRKKSFEEIKNFWYHQVKENGVENPIFALAANKSDLYEKEQVDEGEGKKFADEINAIFKSTSALNNNGIDQLFNYLGKKFLDRSFDYQAEDRKLAEEYKKDQENSYGNSGSSQQNQNYQKRGIKLDANKANKEKKGCAC